MNDDEPDVPSPLGPINIKLDAGDVVAVSDYGALTSMSYNSPYEIVTHDGADTMQVNGGLVVDGIDVGNTLKAMQERFLILEPDFKKHEQYPALKDLYDQYKMMEKLLMDSTKK